MERSGRHRRSISASGIEGIRHIPKNEACSRLSSESHYIGRSAGDDYKFMLELGQSSSRRAAERPMKQILADGIYKEVEPKRRHPSVFSRLVPSLRQHKRSPPDNHPQKNAPLDVRPNRRSSMQEQEFKDVYEDLEASYVANRRSSRWSEPEVAFTPLRKSKRFSIYEKLTERGEIYDTLDMLDLNGANHYCDLQINPCCTHGSHIAVLKPSHSKSERYIASQLEREDGLLLELQNLRKARTPCQSLNIQLEGKNENKIHPGRIVLLRPDHRDELDVRKSSSSDVRFPKRMPHQTRQIAPDITRQMMDETEYPKSSRSRGYAGDESSYDAYESDFDSEIDMFKPSSRNSLMDDYERSKYPSSSFVEWSARREAEKRLPEKWKVTHKYRDLELVVNSCTLGEMLGKPDVESRPKHLNAKTSRARSYDGPAIKNDPLGISSRAGWKDQVSRTSSSRSTSVLPITGTSHRRGTYHDKLSVRVGRFKVGKKNSTHRELFPSQDSRSRGENPLAYNRQIDSSFEIEMEANVKGLTNHMLQMSAKDDAFEGTNSGHGSTTLSPKSYGIVPEQSSSVADEDKAAAAPDQKHQSLGADKDTDHSSPLSVLEVLSAEDTSSGSECFERVGSDSQELGLQVQLLKMESSPNAEETAPPPFVLPEGNYNLGAEDWEVWYALDVLIVSGLQDSGFFDLFRTKWHSQDCPLDPEFFDILEKKYSDEVIGSACERLLIFDRINWAVVGIYEQLVDSFPWVNPISPGLHKTLRKEGSKEAFGKLIYEEVARGGGISQRVVVVQLPGWDYKGEVDGIGNEIEDLLIGAMIDELIYDFSV